MFIADVGESNSEEIDIVTQPGQNFGWPYFEGPYAMLPPCVAPPVAFDPPAYAFTRWDYELASIISVGVYRVDPGARLAFPAEYQGDYFFMDFYQGFLRRLKKVDGAWALAPRVTGQPTADDWAIEMPNATDFQVGPEGSIWYLNFQTSPGELRKIVYIHALLGVPRERAVGASFAAPYPSPALGRMTFSYTLEREARVALDIYDVTGRKVRRLRSSTIESPGRFATSWDGRDDQGERAAPGVYLVRLLVDGQPLQQRVALLR